MFPGRFSHELDFQFFFSIILGIIPKIFFRRIRDVRNFIILTIAFPASSFSSIFAMFAFSTFAELSISALQGFKLLK